MLVLLEEFARDVASREFVEQGRSQKKMYTCTQFEGSAEMAKNKKKINKETGKRKPRKKYDMKKPSYPERSPSPQAHHQQVPEDQLVPEEPAVVVAQSFGATGDGCRTR